MTITLSGMMTTRHCGGKGRPEMVPLYPRGITATFVDKRICILGAGSTSPNERSFLRGIHHPVALGAVMRYLSTLKPT